MVLHALMRQLTQSAYTKQKGSKVMEAEFTIIRDLEPIEIEDISNRGKVKDFSINKASCDMTGLF